MPPEPKPAAKAKRKSKPLTPARAVESELREIDRQERKARAGYKTEVNKLTKDDAVADKALARAEQAHDASCKRILARAEWLEKRLAADLSRISKRRQILKARLHTQS